MKLLLIGIVLAGGVFAVLHFFPNVASKAKISLPNLPQFHLAQNEKTDNPEQSDLKGKVAGISTTAQNTLQGVSTLFLSPSGSDSGTIDMGSVINQIRTQVESIPSHLLDQAKVQYCQQVLIEATKSAKNR